jgi:ABC-2 type transport system ATP-binding protein
VGLFERRATPYHTFSLGMKQRLALASALLGDPLVMILDEPTNGLDPQGIAEIRDLIKTVAAQGKTIILASHLLDEVQKVCTHFAVLDKGKLVHTGPVHDVDAEDLRVELSSEDPDRLMSVLDAFPGRKSVERSGELCVITISKGTTIAGLSRHIYENGIIPTHLLAVRKSLESQFLEILKESK